MELEEVWAGHGGVARSWGSRRLVSSLVLAVRKPPVVAKRTEASQTCSPAHSKPAYLVFRMFFWLQLY